MFENEQPIQQLERDGRDNKQLERGQISIIRYEVDAQIGRCDAIATRLYNVDKCVINQRGRNGI